MLREIIRWKENDTRWIFGLCKGIKNTENDE